MDQTWVINPKTSRAIKIGSMTYNKLINQGVLKNRKIDPNHIYEMKPGDDKKAIMHQLRLTTPMNQNQGLRLRKDGQVRRVYKGGRKPLRSQPEARRTNEQRLKDTQEWTNSKAFKYFATPHNVRGQPILPAETETETDMQNTLEPPPLRRERSYHPAGVAIETETDVTETDNIFED